MPKINLSYQYDEGKRSNFSIGSTTEDRVKRSELQARLQKYIDALNVYCSLSGGDDSVETFYVNNEEVFSVDAEKNPNYAEDLESCLKSLYETAMIQQQLKTLRHFCLFKMKPKASEYAQNTKLLQHIKDELVPPSSRLG